jgi:hypothetical protein
MDSIRELVSRLLPKSGGQATSKSAELPVPATRNLDSWIPSIFQDRIRATHLLGCDSLRRSAVPAESIEPVQVAEMVEAHRWAWKPPRPRLILVAESHVFTTLAELAVKYVNPPGAQHAPSNYVRLVYCLGYGEADLCPELKGGTPQYWSIFGSLVGTSPKHSQGAARSDRLQSKVDTLIRMRDRGTWLLDASLHGIYMSKGERLDTKSRGITADLQRTWWEGYGKHLIEEARPEKVIAVGKGLFNNMSGSIPFDCHVCAPAPAPAPTRRRRLALTNPPLANS